MRRKGWLLTPVLWVTGMAFFFEAFCLLDAVPRTVIEGSEYRVTLGVSHPAASRLLGVAFLVAAVAVIVAETGRHAGAAWWKALALGAWGVASLAILVMLGSGLWSLGRPLGEPNFVRCGTPFLVARQADYFNQMALLVWLGVSGFWIAGSPTSAHRPLSATPPRSRLEARPYARKRVEEPGACMKQGPCAGLGAGSRRTQWRHSGLRATCPPDGNRWPLGDS